MKILSGSILPVLGFLVGIACCFDLLHAHTAPCGDANHSGSAELADVVYLVNYLYNDGPAPQDESEGDVNCDGHVNLGDAVYLVNYLFGDGRAPCDNCLDNTNPRGRLIVANQTEATIYLFDTRTMLRIDSIESVVPDPHFIAVAPDHQHYYAVTRAILAGGQVARYNAVSNSFEQSVFLPAGVIPTGMAVSADNQFGFICDFSSTTQPGSIYKYRLGDLELVDQYGTGAATHDLMISVDGSLIVAASLNSDNVTFLYPEGDSVHIFSLDLDPTNFYEPTGNPHYGPYGVAINHRADEAYIACLNNSQIRIVDVQQRRVVDSVLVPLVAYGNPAGPTMAHVTPDDKYLYVSMQYGNTVVVIDLESRAVAKEIHSPVVRTFGVAVAHAGKRVYIACVSEFNQKGAVLVIDTDAHEIVNTIPAGLNCYGLAWMPAGHHGHYK